MKRLISMLMALMLVLGTATAETSADDTWEYELLWYATELVRQMDAQEQGRLFGGTLENQETSSVIDRGMPERALISVNGAEKSDSVLLFVLLMMDASADTAATDETYAAYLRIVERTFAVYPDFGMDESETKSFARGDVPPGISGFWDG